MELQAAADYAGLIQGLDAATYHAAPGISQSGLKTFASPGGPAKFRAGVRKDTPALKFGGVFHTATLEPHLLEQQWAVTDLEREGTKAWAEAELKAVGRVLVKRADWDRAQRMRDAIMRHPTARELVTPELEIETSFFWRDPLTGLKCRGRADGLRRDWRIAVDLKSTILASDEEFADSCSEWGYDWQEYFYRHGLFTAGDIDIKDFLFIAVEREAPHLINVFEIAPHCIETAGYGVRAALRNLKICYETDEWPGYDPGIRRLNIREHRRRQLPYMHEAY